MAELRNNPKVIPRHISALDGLRALAIVAVIFHHCGEYYLIRNSATTSFLWNFVEGLGNGVDLFFALSGFLITGILLDSLGRPYFFRRFYWRRGLRIWPLYYAFLVAAYLVHRHVFSGLGVAPFALYYRNFLRPDYTSDIYIGQFWSLCVEEQFYLVWPLAIYFAPKRLRIHLIVFLMFSAYFLRLYFSWHGTPKYVVYRLPFCHMDVLLAGAAVAVLLRRGIQELALKKVCTVAALLGLLGIVFIMGLKPANPAFRSLELTSTSLFFGGVVGLCARSNGGIVSGILGTSFLRAISTRSYAMYVFHLVPLYLSYKLLLHFKLLPLGTMPALLVILGVGVVTYTAAWLSWRYLENPLLQLKEWEWFARKRSSVLSISQ